MQSHKFRKYYNERASALNIDSLLGPDIYGSSLMRQVIRVPYAYWEDLIKTKEGRLLDFGCGQGRFSIFPAKNNFKSVIGIDISGNSVKIAEQRAKYFNVDSACSFLTADCEQLPFKDSFFDVVIESGTLPCLDIEKALCEINRVLKPDGSFIMVDTLGHNPVLNLRRRLSVLTGKRLPYVASHILKNKDLRIIEKHFDIKSIRYFNLTTLMAIPFENTTTPLFEKILKLLTAIDNKLFSTIPFIRRYAFKFVVECVKKHDIKLSLRPDLTVI